jgi:hypothetical protein
VSTVASPPHDPFLQAADELLMKSVSGIEDENVTLCRDVFQKTIVDIVMVGHDDDDI